MEPENSLLCSQDSVAWIQFILFIQINFNIVLPIAKSLSVYNSVLYYFRKVLYAFFQPHKRAICPKYLIFLYLITVVIFDEEHSLWSSSSKDFLLLLCVRHINPLIQKKVLPRSMQAVHTSPAKEHLSIISHGVLCYLAIPFPISSVDYSYLHRLP
jgi:hypothetical protein